jgi:hypothetical protein
VYSPATDEASRIIQNTLHLLNASTECSMGFATPEEANAWYTANGPAGPTFASPAVVTAGVHLDLSNAAYSLALPEWDADWCPACPTVRALAHASRCAALVARHSLH